MSSSDTAEEMLEGDGYAEEPYRLLREQVARWEALDELEQNVQGTAQAHEFAQDLTRMINDAERMRGWARLRPYVAHQDDGCTATECACGLDDLLREIDAPGWS